MASVQMIQELKAFFKQTLAECMEDLFGQRKENLSGQKKVMEEKGSAHLVEIEQREDLFFKMEICTLEVEKTTEQSEGVILKMEFSTKKPEILMKDLALQAEGPQRGLNLITGITVMKFGEMWQDLFIDGKPTLRKGVWILTKFKEFAGKEIISRYKKDWTKKKKKEKEEFRAV